MKKTHFKAFLSMNGVYNLQKFCLAYEPRMRYEIFALLWTGIFQVGGGGKENHLDPYNFAPRKFQ